MLNQIHQGDCLEVLATLPEDCVDLVYLDPLSSHNKPRRYAPKPYKFMRLKIHGILCQHILPF